MKNKQELMNRFVYECSCGCTELHFDQWKDNGMAFISLMTPASYSRRYTSFKEGLKIIWSVLTGKRYCFYEIVLEDNNKLNEFKEFVANMTEIKEEK